MIVVADEVSDLLFKVTRQVIVLEQDAVLEGLVPTSPLADRHLLANAERRFYPGSAFVCKASTDEALLPADN